MLVTLPLSGLSDERQARPDAAKRTSKAICPAVGPAPAEPAGEGGRESSQSSDPTSTFRNICGFCHEDDGRHAAKGPQLMGDPSTDEQIFNRIKHGKPGRMAAFGGAFTDEQIHQIVVYIRSLKPGEEPNNP